MNEFVLYYFSDEAIVNFIMIHLLPKSVHDSCGCQMEEMNEMCVHVIQG